MSRYASFGKIPTRPGERDALVAVLLDAAAALQAVPECELYLVHVSPTEADAVWVTEVWTSAEAHAAYLATDEFKAALGRGMPLIGGPVEGIELRPVGGKGLPGNEAGR